jgi:DNA-binding NarL/FixJ family response regulator
MLPSMSGTTPKTSIKRRCILLVDARPLTRGSIAHFLLSASCAYDVIAVSTTGDLSRLPPLARPVDVAILNIGAGRVGEIQVQAEIECLRTRFPATPLAVLADLADTADIQNALRLGVRAYIPSHLSGAVALAGLRILLAGGIFVPATASTTGPVPLSMPQPDAVEFSRTIDPANASPHLHLTLREMDVLRLLRQGRTNRAIAVALNIAESTAKVHVRSIRHKLNAISRIDVVDIADGLLGDVARAGKGRMG